MDTSRRETLTVMGTFGVMGLSGCSDILGRDPVTVERQYSSDSIRDEDEVDDEREIGGGDQLYTDYEGVPDQSEVEYRIEVIDGDTINFYVIEESEFEAWENEDDFDAIEETIHVDHSYIDASVTLDQGDYRFVIDNAGIEPNNA